MAKLEFFPETFDSAANSKLSQQLIFKMDHDPILELLLRHRQDLSSIRVSEPVSLEELINRCIKSKPISYPNRAVLGEEFSDQEYLSLCSKIEQHHFHYQRAQIRDVNLKIEKLKVTFLRLTIEELFYALEEMEYNEDEVALNLTKSDFLSQIRFKIAAYYEGKNLKMAMNTPIAEDSEKSEPESESGPESMGADVSEEESEFEAHSQAQVQVRSRITSPNQRRTSRLRLDDALAQANFEGTTGWSEARVKAHQNLHKNPNTYYYRFNAPGEAQRNGPWSQEEHNSFMKRLAEVGADGQWGIFSKAISGRVGYQCSNYYRKLIEAGEIRDSNYVMDEQGKAHFVAKSRATEKPIILAPKRIRRRAGEAVDELEGTEEDDEEEEQEKTPIMRLQTLPINMPSPSIYYENPLPGFIDAITRTEVIRPAISPHGHVLSYDTWIQCLLNGERKNTCPLTNQPLNKRQLIFLTFENIEMYRDKIMDLCSLDSK